MEQRSRPPSTRGGYKTNNGGVSNAVIFHAIEELKDGLEDVKGTVTDLTKRFDDLPESFTPRREAEEITKGVKDKQDNLDRRVTNIEEWRYQQMERQHQAEIAALQQTNAVATVATAQVAQVATTTAGQVANVRSATDARLIGLLTSGLVGLGTTVLGYILGHLIR